jgi:hypothetical protein
MGDGDVEYLAWNAIDTPIRALRVSHVALRGMSSRPSRQIFKNCILAARIASRFRQRLQCLGICNDVAVTRSPTAYNFGTVPIPLLREPLSVKCWNHSRLHHRSPSSNDPSCRCPKGAFAFRIADIAKHCRMAESLFAVRAQSGYKAFLLSSAATRPWPGHGWGPVTVCGWKRQVEYPCGKNGSAQMKMETQVVPEERGAVVDASRYPLQPLRRTSL